MLTHKNFISVLSALDEKVITEKDNMLCFLPLPHVMQRLFNSVCWFTGCKIAFFGGDITKLKDDIQDSKPSLIILVPRLLNKFYEGIHEELKKMKGCKSKLISTAIQTKLDNLKNKN